MSTLSRRIGAASAALCASAALIGAAPLTTQVGRIIALAPTATPTATASAKPSPSAAPAKPVTAKLVAAIADPKPPDTLYTHAGCTPFKVVIAIGMTFPAGSTAGVPVTTTWEFDPSSATLDVAASTTTTIQPANPDATSFAKFTPKKTGTAILAIKSLNGTSMNQQQSDSTGTPTKIAWTCP